MVVIGIAPNRITALILVVTLAALAPPRVFAQGPAKGPDQNSQAPPDLDTLVKQIRASRCDDALPGLTSLAGGDGLEARRASFLTGWCLARAGRHAEAAVAYRAAAAHPILAPYAVLGEATALLRAGNASEAMTLLRSLSASVPNTAIRLRARILAALGEAELMSRRPSEAVAAVQAAAVLRPDPAVWLLLGDTANAAGRADLARRAYIRAAWAFPGSPIETRAREAFAQLVGRPIAPRDVDAESHLLRGKRLVRDGVWDQAQAELRAGTAPASARTAGEAWYRLGELYLYSNLDGAYTAFRRAAALGWNIDGAWFWTAVAARRLGRGARAREASQALMRVAPRSVWAGRYWFGAGLSAESDGRVADAAIAYRRAIDADPRSDAAAEAGWRLGWMALRAARFTDAESRFRTAGEAAVWRSDAARAWYWAAKSIEARTGRRGEREAATLLRLVAERYPFTFYGQRARTRLELPDARFPPSLPRVFPRTAAAPAHEELARLGLDADAADAAEDLVGQNRDPRLLRFLAERYAVLGDVHQSVAYAEEALAAGQRDELTWRLAYPKAYWSEVTAAAQAAGIDPLLLLALVREESRYEAAVISPARAVGLAQLLPGTAQSMTSDPSMTLQRLKDPGINLRLGARYIRQQLDRFGGDVRLALAAYNAGPGSAQRWVGLDPDPDYFMERIGFTETRAYVRRVLGSYGIYRLLW